MPGGGWLGIGGGSVLAPWRLLKTIAAEVVLLECSMLVKGFEVQTILTALNLIREREAIREQSRELGAPP